MKKLNKVCAISLKGIVADSQNNLGKTEKSQNSFTWRLINANGWGM